MRLVLSSLILVPLAGALLFGFRGERRESVMLLNPSHTCSNCHNLHGGATGEVPLGVNLQITAMCLTCHGPTGSSTLKAEVHVYGGSTCQDCHVSHSNVQNWLGGTNLKLLRDSVLDPLNAVMRPLVFESRGTDVGEPSLHSFADADEDANGVWDGNCDTCHTTLGRHNYNDPGSHNHRPGQTCTRCHGHDTQFRRN